VADVGALAEFLVSDAARRITGTVIAVDGGQHVMA
jgi:enoyl-[acyl-carrier protein] reductase I